MRARTRVPLDHVDIVLTGVTKEDIQALIHVLDPDRNHPARRDLYDELQRAKALLDKGLYEKSPPLHD